MTAILFIPRRPFVRLSSDALDMTCLTRRQRVDYPSSASDWRPRYELGDIRGQSPQWSSSARRLRSLCSPRAASWIQGKQGPEKSWRRRRFTRRFFTASLTVRISHPSLCRRQLRRDYRVVAGSELFGYEEARLPVHDEG